MAKIEVTHTGNPMTSGHPYPRRAPTLLFIRKTAGVSSLSMFIVIAIAGLSVSMIASYFVARRSRTQMEVTADVIESRENRIRNAALETRLGTPEQAISREMPQPHVTKGDPNKAQALSDCRSIADAILLFHRDVGEWPMRNGPNKSSRVDYLYGSVGRRPRFKDTVGVSWGRRSENIRYLLIRNGKRNRPWYRQNPAVADVPGAQSGWNGPYLRDEHADPWGHAYLVSVCGFPGGTKPKSNVWCLSAGPNGIVETSPAAKELRGDDVGIWVR